MIQDMCWDLEETLGMWIHTTRCMNCGHISEPTIDKHRQQATTAAAFQTVTFEGDSLHAMGEV
jgi:hypothetical protein